MTHASKTNPEYRDRTRTPAYVFDALNDEFSFSLDVAALPETALLPWFLTPEINALAVDWRDYAPFGGVFWAWCNPPYSDIRPWVVKAMEQQKCGIGTVMLVPQDQSGEWYQPNEASELRLITGYYDERGRWRSGRIAFINAETGKEMKGNNKGSMLLIFDPYPRSSRTVLAHVTKLQLMQRGGQK